MTNSATVLRQFVEELEELDAERDEVGSRIKLKYADLKSAGFSSKIVRRLIALRKMDPDKRQEEDDLLASYAAAIGESDLA